MLCVAQDGELVCRHAQCDLHTTTNILGTSLASKCTQPFGHSDGPKCCTSDITLAEFRTLRGKMDASVSGAATAEEYMGGTADWRTDLYSKGKHGKLDKYLKKTRSYLLGILDKSTEAAKKGELATFLRGLPIDAK